MTKSLIQRLEEASEGSRELDAEIWLKFNRPDFTGSVKAFGLRDWYDGRCHYILETDGGEEMADTLGIASVTSSVDAGLSLANRALPGWYVGLQANRYEMVDYPDDWTAYLSAPRGHDFGDIEGDSPSPSLALCIAILKAKESHNV